MSGSTRISRHQRTKWSITKAHIRRIWGLNIHGIKLWWGTINSDHWKDGT